jgi:pimeloyl-ACP methyl ester carboxylesterase
MKEEVTFVLPRSGQTLRGQRTPVGVGTPTLCLHGWLDNCASFEPLFERTADLNLTAVDLPGHGLSDPIRSAACL